MLSARSSALSRPAARGASARRAPVVGRRTSVRVQAVMDVTTDTWEKDVLASDLPVLVDFWAPWCGPCKLVAPLMTWAEKEYQGKLRVVKVEHDRAKELVERYGVYGLPGFLVVKEGKMLEGSLREGAMSKKKLIVYIEEQTGLKAAAA